MIDSEAHGRAASAEEPESLAGFRYRPSRESNARPSEWLMAAWLVAAVGLTVGLSVSRLSTTLAGPLGMFIFVVAFVVNFCILANRQAGRSGGHPQAASPDWRAEWLASRRRFDDLRARYAAYECDPLAVLRLPALADVTVASTARFVDAFAQAQGLHSEHEKPEPPEEHAISYRRAVERAWQTWHAAYDAAERIRLAGLSPRERATVQRTIKLLTTASESDNDAERHAAYVMARAELAKLEHRNAPTTPPSLGRAGRIGPSRAASGRRHRSDEPSRHRARVSWPISSLAYSLRGGWRGRYVAARLGGRGARTPRP